MAISRPVPQNTIRISSDPDPLIVGDLVASEAITPGMLIETVLSGTDQVWRKNASATEQVEIAVALNQPELNLTIDDDYAANDLVQAWKPKVGDVFLGIVASGQNIAKGDLLQAAGGGYVKEATDTTADKNLAKFKSLSSTSGAVTVDTRVECERIN